MPYLDLRDLADELDALRASAEAGEEHDEARLAALEALEDEFSRSLREQSDGYEPTMIPEEEFENYARELAEDIGAIPADNQWPLYCIDWNRAASELRYDYTSITFDSDDYLIRSS